MDITSLPIINLSAASIILTNKKGIYFWLTKETDRIVYIGVALGVGGLRRRIINQHLNPSYIEYRLQKHTEKDNFQLEHAIHRVSKDTKHIQYGIDKSSFRKSLGRKLKLKPGQYTVNYIIENLYLKVFESEVIDELKTCEVELIQKYAPEFNTSHKKKLGL